MSKFIVEIPVGFNYSTEVEADNVKDAIEAAIFEAESNYSISELDCEYERNNAYVKEL